MKEFITNPDVSYIITITGFIFGLIGVISAFFGIKSYFEQRKTSKAYEFLLNNAELEWEGKYTQEEITRLHSELSMLTKQISKEIPFQARKVLLESKIEKVEYELLELYQEHRYLKKELEKIHPVGELDKNIRDYIKNEINVSKPKRKFILTVLVAVLAFVFFSSPVINMYVYDVLGEIIYFTEAQVYVEHITTYVMAMITSAGIVLMIPFQRLHMIILQHKKISALMILILFILWGALLYFITFNVLIISYYAQLLAGIVSVVIFAMAFKITVVLSKSIR